MEPEKKGHGVMWAVVVVIIALVAYGAYAYTKKDDATTPEIPATTNEETHATAMYKDGEYSAVGNYNSPGGAEQISVKLTLKDDLVVSADVQSLAVLPTSKMMQAKFISGYQQFVIGKKITDVTLDKVSGSSLTPKGWNDAIAKIKVQAAV